MATIVTFRGYDARPMNIKPPRVAFCLVPTLLIVLLTPAHAVAAPSLDQASPAVREIIAREQEMRAALLAGDEPKTQQIIAAEFVMMNANGLNTRESYFDGVLRKRKMLTLDIKEMRAAVYGETALVWGRIAYTATGLGKTIDTEIVLTDAWIKRDGRWQLLTRHSGTSAAAAAAAAASTAAPPVAK